MEARIVIVGAGHAGGSVAAMLRQHGHVGQILLIGEEPVAPYQRPPLSKAYLKGAVDVESLKLRPDSFYAENDITLRLGDSVTAIDRTGRQVLMHGGGGEPYDILILATGSQNRPLPIPGAKLHGVHGLRSLADAEALSAMLRPGARLVIVGGGYIGLEVAASARSAGCDVTVVEREARVLARVASATLSRFFSERHAAAGVDILVNAQVEGLTEGPDGYVSAVQLTDGCSLPCDAVLIGIGAQACDHLAVEAGLACSGGVIVDAQSRTSDPDIFAIGDMTLRPLPLYEDRMWRLESVPNALEQAKQATAAILGLPRSTPETPWFWSDQYEVKLQIAGLPLDADQQVVRGDPSSGAFAVFHMRGEVMRAVEAVNAPAEFMAGRRLIGSAARVSASRLADLSNSMKSVEA